MAASLRAPCGVQRASCRRRHAANIISITPMLALTPVTQQAAARLRRAATLVLAAAASGRTPPKQHQPLRSLPPKQEDNIWMVLLNRLSKAAAVLALAGAVALGCALPAAAARSGGRIGGSSGFASRGSYGNSMGGRSMGSSFSSSFGSASGSSGRASPIVFSSISPLGFFSPFGMGYGYGMGYGGGGGGLVSLLFWGFFAVTLVQVVRGVLDKSGGGGGRGGGGGGGAAIDTGESQRELAARKKIKMLRDGPRSAWWCPRHALRMHGLAATPPPPPRPPLPPPQASA
jgi:hypothetical protein